MCVQDQLLTCRSQRAGLKHSLQMSVAVDPSTHKEYVSLTQLTALADGTVQERISYASRLCSMLEVLLAACRAMSKPLTTLMLVLQRTR